jgi:hypothetical protein
MDTYAKMKKRRDTWRGKTAAANAKVRYQRREIKRLKKQRDQQKQALRKAEQALEDLKRRHATRAACEKTDLVFLALQLFLAARIGFRAVSRVLAVLAPVLGLAKTPCPQTIANWVTRLSLVRMTGFPSPAHCGVPRFPRGFILLLDASIGLGKGKILTVLALDAGHHGLYRAAPALQHVSCVAVAVAETWTGESIAQLLRGVIARIGTPLAYLKDGGTDLGKAVRLLNETGSGGASIGDISHFVANLLKHVFENHPRFEVFLRACGAVSRRFKQSILAALTPPKVSTKARFMNLLRLVKWADLLLKHSPRGRAANGSLLQKLRERLDRLPLCRRFIKDFLRNAEPLIECQKILKTTGLSQKSYDECRSIVAAIPHPVIRTRFLAWLDDHLAIAYTLGLDGIGLPISSDSIESLFGVAKHHGTGEIKDANRIAMRIPALCGELTRQDAENVLRITVKEQQQSVGSLPSLTRQRREVLAGGGSLESIEKNAAQPDVRLIAGSKSAQKRDHSIDNTVFSANGGDP